MQRSSRTIAAVQRDQAATYKAYDRLVEAGIPRQRIEILAPGEPRAADTETAAPDRTLWRIVVGAMAGMVGGGIVGGLVCAGSWLLEIGLFVAQPWVASFFIVAYTAGAGAIVGALIGSRFGRSAAAHVEDAVAHGQWVVVVNAADRDQRDRAQIALTEDRPSLPRAA